MDLLECDNSMLATIVAYLNWRAEKIHNEAKKAKAKSR